jgi:hypothetical protein
MVTATGAVGTGTSISGGMGGCRSKGMLGQMELSTCASLDAKADTHQHLHVQ